MPPKQKVIAAFVCIYRALHITDNMTSFGSCRGADSTTQPMIVSNQSHVCRVYYIFRSVGVGQAGQATNCLTNISEKITNN